MNSGQRANKIPNDNRFILFGEVHSKSVQALPLIGMEHEEALISSKLM